MGKYLQGFKGMRQDINEANMDPNYYYYAQNLTTSTENNISNIGGIGNIKGDELLSLIPTDINDYGATLKAINGGIEVDNDKTILFVNYLRNNFTNYNVIYLVDHLENTIKSIYKPDIYYNDAYLISIDDMSLTADAGNIEASILTTPNYINYTEGDLNIYSSYKLSIIHNKENELINKIYWIDGINQVRSLNIATILSGEDEYLTTPIDQLNAVSKVDFTTMSVNSTEPTYGGSLTSGRVQYAYSYYSKNGQASGISPLSEIISITTSEGLGGDLNDVVGQNNNILIDTIDLNYDVIQLYRVKYNSYTEEPVINLIQERLIYDTTTSLTFVDVGTNINTVSSEEFLFLGSDIYYPGAFEIKDDRMFIANFTEDNWNITLEDVDCRAYRFNSSTPSYNILVDGESYKLFQDIPITADCISNGGLGWNQKRASTDYGATGQNIELSIIGTDLDISNRKPYYRAGEVYRFGIIFYNSMGKKSTPQWICDYQMPDEAKEYYVEVDFDSSNLDLESLDIVGYQVVRVERTDNDKFTIASGVANPCMYKSVIDSADSDEFFESEPSMEQTNHSRAFVKRESEVSEVINYPIYTVAYPKPSATLISTGLSGNFTISGLDQIVGTNGSYLANGTYYSYYFDTANNYPRYACIPTNSTKVYTIRYNASKWWIQQDTDILFYGDNVNDNVTNTVWKTYVGDTVQSTSVVGNLTTTKVESGDSGGQSFLNHTSILSGNSGFSSRVGYSDDIVPTYNSTVTDIPLSKGIDYDGGSDGEFRYSFINSKTWQIHSPEITLETSETSSITKVSIASVIKSYSSGANSDYKVGAPFLYGERYNTTTGTLEESMTSERFYDLSLDDDFDDEFVNNGMYWIPGGDKYNRQCYDWDVYSTGANGTISYDIARPSTIVNYDIYGNPLLMDTGATTESYNNNPDYKISNNLYDFTNDVSDDSSTFQSLGINSEGTKCMYIIPLKNDLTTGYGDSSIINHERLERAAYDVGNLLGYSDSNNWWNHITVNLKSSNTDSSIYNGNTYEARSRNSYMVIGDYKEIDDTITNNSIILQGTGDTYYRNWTFARSVIGSLELNDNTMGLSENISVPIETYVELNNRNDLTSNFDKEDETNRDISALNFESESETFNYNKVYNREPNFFTEIPSSYIESTLDHFPNLIRASSQKTPGELQDSFLNILVNEETNLNSKYGPINKLKLFRDSIYVFQENAIAYQSVNPRAQVVADDGISVELGTGTLFGSDKYLTTESGVSYLDRSSVTSGNNSLYYFDRMNSSINMMTNNGVIGLSESKMISKLVKNNLVKTSTRGAISGFDFITNNLLISYPSDNGLLETVVYNEAFGEFISVRDINPSQYIQSRDGLMGLNYSFGMLDSVGLYLIERDSSYNNMLGSDLTEDEIKLSLLVKPKEYASARYDSLEWKSINRGFDNNPNIVNKIRAYNEEQDSGNKEVKPRNKFDMWRLNLPRGNDRKVGNRLNGRWLYIDMYFGNTISEESTHLDDSQFNIYNIGVDYANKL